MSTLSVSKVSIIIPAYNAAPFIAATLESVLAQTCSEDEIIVVDDGSTDDTKVIIGRYGDAVTYVHQSNQGPSAARNHGIRMASGQYICFLDADDSWMPGKLQTQFEFMNRHPSVGLTFADEEEYDESGLQSASLLSTSRYYSELRCGGSIPDSFQKLLVENFIPTSTVMVRSECFERVGLFDVALKGPEDRDMWSRIAAHFEIACMPEVLGRKRVVSSSVSRNVETTLRSRLILWSKARKLFPELAPTPIINSLLAPTYLQLGFLLLDRNETREAREVAIRGVRIARHFRLWVLGIALITFSFTGKRVADAAFRLKRALFPISPA